jgi:hypothetical protein
MDEKNKSMYKVQLTSLLSSLSQAWSSQTTAHSATTTIFWEKP